MQKSCIIIPCYNEAKRLPVCDFNNYLEQNRHEIKFCFVNDGSSDTTLEVLQSFASAWKENIKIVNLQQNQGKAEAVRRGILESLVWENFEYIGYFDADLSTPLDEINRMVKKHRTQPNLLLVMGSRIQRLGTHIVRNRLRHYFGRVFSTVASLMLALPVYDTQCGAKVFKTSIAQKVFQTPFISGWLFDIEILFRLKKDFTEKELLTHVLELPLNEWVEKGASKIKLIHLLKVPIELLKIYLTYR